MRSVNAKSLSLNSSCSKVVPSHQLLSDWQKAGLKLASSREGRDVVLAIDLTGSVKLNDEGRLRLRQIIQDSLNPGDSVYVVPFASTVNPLQPGIDSLSAGTAVSFLGKAADVDNILQKLPLESNDAFQNTDIQLAEATVYRGLAQLNQCRMTDNKSVRFQSIVWITDAPLLTKPGIKSEVWIETPKNSPFRGLNSSESKERQDWVSTLPLQRRSQKIGTYDLSVVDISPTVQEFCTPAPGGRETCLVNSYLFNQLWLPALLGLVGTLTIFVGGTLSFRYLCSLQKAWKLTITGENESDCQIHYIRNRQRLSIGNDIVCHGQEVRGYLWRKGNKLFLVPEPGGILLINYQNSAATQPIMLKGKYIRLNYQHKSSDLELTISIN